MSELDRWGRTQREVVTDRYLELAPEFYKASVASGRYALGSIVPILTLYPDLVDEVVELRYAIKSWLEEEKLWIESSKDMHEKLEKYEVEITKLKVELRATKKRHLDSFQGHKNILTRGLKNEMKLRKKAEAELEKLRKKSGK